MPGYIDIRVDLKVFLIYAIVVLNYVSCQVYLNTYSTLNPNPLTDK